MGDTGPEKVSLPESFSIDIKADSAPLEGAIADVTDALDALAEEARESAQSFVLLTRQIEWMPQNDAFEWSGTYLTQEPPRVGEEVHFKCEWEVPGFSYNDKVEITAVDWCLDWAIVSFTGIDNA